MQLASSHMAWGLIVFTLALSVSATAYAQTAPNGGATPLGLPGAVIQQNQRPENLHITPVEPSLQAPPEPEVEQAPAKTEAPDTSLSQKFPVKSIEIKGDRKLDEHKARKLISAYEGKELSFMDLRELADKLTELYRQEGFVTSIVYVGPQRIENGHIVLTAAEGVVGEVTYEPGKYFKRWAVLPRIDAYDDGVFQVGDLQRSLRRINQNPDLKVRATLEAGDKPDQTNVRLEPAEEHFPFHVTPFWDNLGRQSIGYQRFGVTSVHNNLLGLGDQAFNSVAWTKSSFGVVSHYGVPVGKHGTWINFDHSYSTLKVRQQAFQNADIRGKASIFTPSIMQELWNTEKTRASVDLAFDFMDIDSYFNGQQFAEDRLRVLRPGFNFDAYDRSGRTIMRHEFGIGLDVVDATQAFQSPSVRVPQSRLGAGSQFFRYTGNITRLQRLPLGTYAILRASGQLTPDRLATAQQYQVGGAFTVRGYREGQFIGDNGYVFSAELRSPFYLFPSSWVIPRTTYKLRDNVQLVGFTDFGAVYTNNPAPGIPKHQYALGSGVGLRANLTSHVAGRVDFGFPIVQHSGFGQRIWVHFGLETRLF